MKYHSSINQVQQTILTINGGSSSIKFALFNTNKSRIRLLHGSIDRIGLPDPKLTFSNGEINQKKSVRIIYTDEELAFH